MRKLIQIPLSKSGKNIHETVLDMRDLFRFPSLSRWLLIKEQHTRYCFMHEKANSDSPLYLDGY